MYQKNPLTEAFLVKNPSKRVFHKGQLKQASYSLKQARLQKSSLELRLSKIDDSIKILEKKLSLASSPLTIKDLQHKIKELSSRKITISKLIKVQDGIINSQQMKMKRMSAANKKVGASMI